MANTRFAHSLICLTIVFVCLFRFLGGGALAEEPTPGLVWEARYGHSYSEDYARAAATDEAGNIYVTGSGAGPMGSEDFVTLKYDPAGVPIWEAYYNLMDINSDCYPNLKQGADSAKHLGVDGTGNVYVTGTTWYTYFCPVNHSHTVSGTMTVKYNPEGIQLWEIGHGGFREGELTATAVDQAGNLYITGYCTWGCSGYVTTKYNTRGWPEWSANYMGMPSGYEYATDIALDGLGNAYVTGRSRGEGSGFDYATIKYDPEGNELWVARYDGPAADYDTAESIFVNSVGEVFVTGSSEGAGTGKDIVTIKYDLDGSEVWAARYLGPADSQDEAVSVAEDGVGSVFVTGTVDGVGSGPDIVTIGYDSLGFQMWEQRYNGPADGSDRAVSLTVTGAGTVVVSGTSAGVPSADDYVTIGYASSSGAELWAVRYNGPASGEDMAASLTPDGSGNVVVTGSSQGVETGPDYTTIKYGPGGEELWTERFVSPWVAGARSLPSAMHLDPLGNICITGSIDSNGYGTVKYDSEGNELWTAQYDNPVGYEYARDLAVDTEGNILVTGHTSGLESVEAYLTVKYDPDGNELWVALYDGAEGEEDVAASVAVDPSGNVYVTGYSEGTGTFSDYITVKYGPDGEEHWVSRYDGPLSSTDIPVSIAVDSWSNVYVTGKSGGVGTGYDFATAKYDPEGNELWVARYDGPAGEGDEAESILVNDFGEAYVTGSSEGAGTNSDFATIKYDQDGNEVWVARYDGPTNEGENAVALALDGTGNVYVTGWSYYADWEVGTATIKYDPDGNEVWEARYEAPGDGVLPIDVSVDSSGSVYVVGTIGHSHPNYMILQRSEYILVKYDSEGKMEWEVFYDGPFIGATDDGRDEATAMALDDSGDIYVTGSSRPLGQVGYQMTTLRYTQAPECSDQDGDGYGVPESQECPYPVRDCDDADPDINPGNMEDTWQECHNGIDDDCDGFLDATLLSWYHGLSCTCYDADWDGYGAGSDDGDPSWWAGCPYPGRDCEEYHPYIHPSAPELCDGIDNQCPGDPGYGKIDEGCPLELVSPENGAGLTDPPTFTWLGGENDQFYVYLVIPIYGYGYLTFVIPTADREVAFPAEAWQDKTIPTWWCAWRVLGVSTSVEPPTLEASELWWFRKVEG